MITKLLLPNRYKKIGWWILIPSIIFGAILIFYEFDSNLLRAKVFALIHGEIFDGNQYFTFIRTVSLIQLSEYFLL